MKKVIKLAKRANGSTHPNPMVAAMVVKDNKIVSCGYHKRAGTDHAEIIALRKAKNKTRDAKLYVNLEPCSNFGKTPPCVDEIIKSKVREVIIATEDPNPLNNLRGIKKLRSCGIKVTTGILKNEAMKLNEDFSKFIRKKLPFITVKIAESLDGKIATAKGDSKWITSFTSRRYAHKLRACNDAVLVGVETIIKDNPQLNCRYHKKLVNQPKIIVLDSKLRVPEDAKIFSKVSSNKVIIVTTKYAPKKKLERLKDKNITFLVVKSKERKVDLRELLKELARKEIVSILVEGGSQVITSFLNERLVDKIIVFIAPKVIGGRDAPGFLEGKGIRSLKDAILLKDIKHKRINDDLVIEGYIYPLR